MPKARTTRRKETRRVAGTPPAPLQASASGSTVSVVAALGILAACLTPFLLWGNPYPEQVVRYWLLGAPVVAAAAIGVALLDPRRIGGIVRNGVAAITKPSPLAFSWFVGLATCGLALFLSSYAFHRMASTTDEIAEVWHARILSTGRLSLRVDPNREFFALETVVDRGRWYSQFPIGGPLSLLPGVLLGVPWLVNPVFAGLSTGLLYRFARRAFGEIQGRVATLLFAITPMMLFMAGTRMNHVPVLFLTTSSLAALAKWEQDTSTRSRIIASVVLGLSLGLMATIRPLDAVAVALVIGVFQLWVLSRSWVRAPELLAQIIAGVVGVSPLLIANWRTTGSPLTFGYDVSWGAGHRFGFHTDPYGNPHTLRHALELAITYVSELNMYLMAWPIPALIVLVVGLLTLRSVSRWDSLLLGLFAAQLGAYALYWGDGEFLGPRFLFTALSAMVLLMVRGCFAAASRWPARLAQAGVGLVLASCLVGWLAPTSVYGVWGLARSARDVRGSLKLDIEGAVRRAGIHHALVFLHEPFGARLARRLWGLGIMRSEAAQLLASRDACSLLRAIDLAELDTDVASQSREATVRSAAAMQENDAELRTADRTTHVRPGSVTPECRAELEADTRLSSTPFGPALPLEPISPTGQIDGDVIYLADLGNHNSVLVPRFGDRTWYRLTVAADSASRLRPVLLPY